jgi:hypothetical protein
MLAIMECLEKQRPLFLLFLFKTVKIGVDQQVGPFRSWSIFRLFPRFVKVAYPLRYIYCYVILHL